MMPFAAVIVLAQALSAQPQPMAMDRPVAVGDLDTVCTGIGEAKDDPRWLAVALDLKRIVDGHIRQEEEIDFPALRNSLDDGQTAVMSGGVAREKALIL